MENHVSVDPVVFELLTWILGGLFTAITGILIWLSKNIITKINQIVKNQQAASEIAAVMIKDVDEVKKDLDELKDNLKTIPDLKQGLSNLEIKTANNAENIGDFKKLSLHNQNKINELDKLVVKLNENIKK